MPKSWKMDQSTWIRYFNARVNGNNGGIDPFNIFLFEDGMTVGQKFSGIKDVKISNAPWFKTALKKRTAEVKKAGQEAVSQNVNDKVEMLIDNMINGIEGLAGPKGALQANIAAVPLNIVVGGLRATKLAYRGAKNLAAAIEAGYQVVKDHMSRKEWACLLYTSPSPRDATLSRMPSSA